MHVVRPTIVALCILSLMGCSGGKVKKKGAGNKAPAAASAGSETTDPASASTEGETEAGRGPETPAQAPPAIDETSGLDLDGNRVRAFSPVGWKRGSRSRDYLVRYQSGSQLAYPTILIVAADPPEGFADVATGNHEGFVAAIASRLAEEFGTEGKPKLLRAPAATKVGKHFAVSWLAPGEGKLDAIPKKIERECVAIVVNGRMYTVETWAPVGKLDDKTKAAGLAVVQALAVPSLDPVEPLVPFGSPPPADAPVEQPAEEPKAT
jgi:hypothetical protein